MHFTVNQENTYHVENELACCQKRAKSIVSALLLNEITLPEVNSPSTALIILDGYELEITVENIGSKMYSLKKAPVFAVYEYTQSVQEIGNIIPIGSRFWSIDSQKKEINPKWKKIASNLTSVTAQKISLRKI
jgi:hypothetical protein